MMPTALLFISFILPKCMSKSYQPHSSSSCLVLQAGLDMATLLYNAFHQVIRDTCSQVEFHTCSPHIRGTPPVTVG